MEDQELSANLNKPASPCKKRKKQKQNCEEFHSPCPKSSRKDFKLQGMKGHEVRARLMENHIKFCQDLGLIAKSVKCFCGEDMRLMRRNSRGVFAWRCRKAVPVHSKRDLSVRTGTWFANSKLAIEDIMWIAYMWLHEYSYCSMMHETVHSPHTLMDWLTSCRVVSQAIMKTKLDVVGGLKEFVEVFECKRSMGLKAVQSQWGFCGIQHLSSKAVMEIVKDHSSSAILQLFEKYILPGTTVFGSVWNAYSELNKKSFDFLTCEKSITFYDSLRDEEMCSFQDFKNATKRPIPKELDFDDDQAFCEAMYRKLLVFATDGYLTFLGDISKIFRPCDQRPDL